MALAAAAAQFAPLPCIQLKFLQFSWTFYGVAEGEVAVLGLEEFEETGKFGAFWLRKGEVIGAFLEGGEKSDITAIQKCPTNLLGFNHHHALTTSARHNSAHIAQERPKVPNLASLIAAPLTTFLKDPHNVHEVRAAGVPNPNALTARRALVEAYGTVVLYIVQKL
eukprot:10088-Heterococcus_DN1.PRE.2